MIHNEYVYVYKKNIYLSKIIVKILKYQKIIEISFRSNILCVSVANMIAFTDQSY